MLEMGIYSFYDKKSDRYDTPFVCMTDINAKRHFIMATRKPGTIVAEFQDDIELYQLGRFDPLTGEMRAEKRHIMDGKSIQKEENNHAISNET